MNINLLIVVCIFLCVAMFVYDLLAGVHIIKVKVAEHEFDNRTIYKFIWFVF